MQSYLDLEHQLQQRQPKVYQRLFQIKLTDKLMQVMIVNRD